MPAANEADNSSDQKPQREKVDREDRRKRRGVLVNPVLEIHGRLLKLPLVSGQFYLCCYTKEVGQTCGGEVKLLRLPHDLEPSGFFVCEQKLVDLK